MIVMDDLHPDMVAIVGRFEGLVEASDLDVLIYCGRRSGMEQARLWRRGRSTSSIEAQIAERRDYQGEILDGREDPTPSDIERGRLAETGIPSLREFAPADTDHISVARFLNWSLGLIIGVGPQKGETIVTNAMPGYSAHQYGVAIDAVPTVDGKALWDDPGAVHEMGEIGEAAGMEWAGRWTTFKERVHFQLPDWRSNLMGAD